VIIGRDDLIVQPVAVGTEETCQNCLFGPSMTPVHTDAFSLVGRSNSSDAALRQVPLTAPRRRWAGPRR